MKHERLQGQLKKVTTTAKECQKINKNALLRQFDEIPRLPHTPTSSLTLPLPQQPCLITASPAQTATGKVAQCQTQTQTETLTRQNDSNACTHKHALSLSRSLIDAAQMQANKKLSA